MGVHGEGTGSVERDRCTGSDRSSKAAAVAPTLRQFTLDFFGFFGATVTKENRRANGPVHVMLGDELSEHFGAGHHAPVFRTCRRSAGRRADGAGQPPV